MQTHMHTHCSEPLLISQVVLKINRYLWMWARVSVILSSRLGLEWFLLIHPAPLVTMYLWSLKTNVFLFFSPLSFSCSPLPPSSLLWVQPTLPFSWHFLLNYLSFYKPLTPFSLLPSIHTFYIHFFISPCIHFSLFCPLMLAPRLRMLSLPLLTFLPNNLRIYRVLRI